MSLLWRSTPKCPFDAEVPLPAFLRLMHARIAGAGGVLRGRGRGDDRRVHDRAGAHRDALGAQVLADGVEEDVAEPVLLEPMAELAHRGLVRHRLAPEIDADERPHRRRVVQRFFHGRVGEIEPVLKEVHPQHALQANGRPSVAGLGVDRLDPRTQCSPRHHPVHLGEELRPPRGLRVLFKPGAGQRGLRSFHPHLPWWPAARLITARPAQPRKTYSEIP
jgi:hypothetical protein